MNNTRSILLSYIVSMDERYTADNVIVIAAWMCVWREQGALRVSYTTPFVDRPKKDSNVYNVWETMMKPV